jgi:F0F1-type ATP synthase assembly protein I
MPRSREAVMKNRSVIILSIVLLFLSCSELGMGPSQKDFAEVRSASIEVDDDPAAQAEWTRLEASTSAGDLYGAKNCRILTTSVEMVVQSFVQTLGGVKKIVKEEGGQIMTTESRKDDEGLTSGMVEVKIPADRYDKALARISKLGQVNYMEEKSEDVTKEFVDLTARLDNAKKLEARILELLQTHTGNIQDVMNVEKELGSVREKIEEMEGRKRYLENKIQYSTITVRMYEKGARFGAEMTPGELFKQIVNKIGLIFVGSLGLFIVIIVGAAPWGVALALLIVVIRGVLKRRKKARPAKAS